MKTIERLYLNAVAQLGCVVCRNLGYGASPAVIHHIREDQGISQRASNFLVIPLCPMHHTDGGRSVAFHKDKRAWQNLYGNELELLAQTVREIFDARK